jgi:hypothetical protein
MVPGMSRLACLVAGTLIIVTSRVVAHMCRQASCSCVDVIGCLLPQRLQHLLC